MSWRRIGLAEAAVAALASAGAVALVTAGIAIAKPYVPVLSLGVLYVFAVLPVAVAWGLVYAVPVSVASMLAFNWFFLPPTHTFALRDSANWFALAVYVVTAVVVSELAARSRRRAADAARRELEATLLADVAATLLEADHVQERLKDVAGHVAHALGLDRVRIELASVRRPDPRESATDLRFGTRHVGRIFYPAGATLPPDASQRILPAVSSMLAVAVDRERLSLAAVEAEALRRSDAIKTAVLRAVSHDLRSPLTAIRAAAEGLERADLALDARDRAELVDAIRAEAARLERVVTNLIDLSRLEAGAASPRPEVWSADELVARSLEPLAAAAERVVVVLPA